jgi:ribonuclease HIII
MTFGDFFHAWRLRFPSVFFMDILLMASKASNSNGENAKKKSSYNLKLTPEQMDKLGQALSSRGWPTREVQYARHAFDGDQVKVVAYESGKLVVQGRGTEDFVSNILEPEVTGEFLMGYEEVNNPEWFEPHAGLDESGKGDLFGPVVSACVIADADMVRKWMDAGIRDSKTITDGAILKMAKIIATTQGVVIKTAFTGMLKYNELYLKFGENLNKLLAWLHGRALNDALALRKPKWGLLDQFSKQPLVQKYVEGEDFDLQMRTKAESDPVVAAASVIARATWLDQMKKLEEKAGRSIPKGSGSQAKEVATALFEELGEERMKEFCKMHFKTAYEAMGKKPPAKKTWNPKWKKG